MTQKDKPSLFFGVQTYPFFNCSGATVFLSYNNSYVKNNNWCNTSK